jgi:hypothetical protein
MNTFFDRINVEIVSIDRRFEHQKAGAHTIVIVFVFHLYTYKLRNRPVI